MLFCQSYDYYSHSPFLWPSWVVRAILLSNVITYIQNLYIKNVLSTFEMYSQFYAEIESMISFLE